MPSRQTTNSVGATPLNCHALNASWGSGGHEDGLGSEELARLVESSLCTICEGESGGEVGEPGGVMGGGKSSRESDSSDSSDSNDSSDSSDSSHDTDEEVEAVTQKLLAAGNVGFMEPTIAKAAQACYCYARVTEATGATGKPGLGRVAVGDLETTRIVSLADGGLPPCPNTTLVFLHSTISAANVGAEVSTPFSPPSDLVVLVQQRLKWSRVFSRQGARGDPAGYVSQTRSLTGGKVETRLLECLPGEADQGVLQDAHSVQKISPPPSLYRPSDHPGASALCRYVADPKGLMEKLQIPPVYRVAECFFPSSKSRQHESSTVLWVSPIVAATTICDVVGARPKQQIGGMTLLTGVKHVVSIRDEKLHVFGTDIDTNNLGCRKLQTLLEVWRQGASVSTCLVPEINWKLQMLQLPQCVPITNWWHVATTTGADAPTLEMILKPPGLVVPVTVFYAGLALQFRESPLPLSSSQDRLLSWLVKLMQELSCGDIGDLTDFWAASGMVPAGQHPRYAEVATIYQRANKFGHDLVATRNKGDPTPKPTHFTTDKHDTLHEQQDRISQMCLGIGLNKLEVPNLSNHEASGSDKLAELEKRISKLEVIIENSVNSMRHMGQLLLNTTQSASLVN